MTAACPACTIAPPEIRAVELPNTVQLSVPSIRCAACIGAIERKLNQLPSVRDARVNLTRRRVSVSTTAPVSDLISALAQIGYEAYPLDANALGADIDQAGRDLLLRLGVAGFAMMNVMLLSVAVWAGAAGATRDLFHLISAAVALPAMLYAAQPFFLNAAGALRAGRLNMDVPISLAIVLAGAMSLYESLNGGAHAYFDAGLSLTFFLLIGRYLEHRTRSAARSAVKELTALEVHTAQRKNGTRVEAVPVESLLVGDTILVATGMRVPVDGRLLSSAAHTDRAFLTGESDPVTHTEGAVLHAGEINLGAPFDLMAEAVGQDTRLHQIANLVETAENARNRYTSLADKAAKIYAPAVHLLAGATFVGWLLATGDVRHALNVAIAVLIITCPCALGLAVPAVSTAAISRLYRLGFLVKSGTALERLAEVRSVVLDKTGTLTRPGFDFDLSDLTPTEMGIAKALAQGSAHPISRALTAYLGDITPASLSALVETKGGGVSADLNGLPVALGRAAWLGLQGNDLVLQVGGAVHPLPCQESLRDGADQLAQGLAARGLQVQIVSGDSEEKTRALAAKLQIADYAAGMLPEDKNRHVRALAEGGQLPCMIGDGLNDTIALSSAHASIAPGTALDAARNAADIVVVGSSVSNLPKLFAIADSAVRLSRQNFWIAVAYNAVAIPIAIAGYATPLAAALAMSLSSISVLLNAIRVGARA